ERLDLRRRRQQLGRVGHERLRDRSVQMRLAAAVVGEHVEDAERRRAEPHREPRDGRRLAVGQLQRPGEKAPHLFRFLRLGLEPRQQSHTHHVSPPEPHPSDASAPGPVGKTDIYDIVLAMRVQVLVLDGAFDLGLAAVLDTLTTANDLAGDGKGGPRFSVERVGMRRRARTQQGLSLPLAPAGRGRAPDLIIVPALGCKTPETLTAALARRDVADAGAFLRGQAAAGARVTAACTATFVLAQSGLLDGRGATTTWWLAPLFRERFPRVELDESRMIVESGRFATAGAALAHLDLALWLVRRR